MTGMEAFVDPLAGGLVGVLIDTAKKVGGGFAQAVGDRTKVAHALKRYADKYAARYGTIRVLGMRQDVFLESVYTKVSFLDESGIHRFTSLQDLEQNYRSSQKRRLQVRETSNLDGFTVANDNQYLMVLGGPGAGKSTFLRRLGLEALKGDRGGYKYQCIPVFIELKRFNASKIDLLEAIVDELQNFGFPTSQEFAVKLLEQGRLLILLDGLDEVPRVNLNIVVDTIQGFVTKYDKNRFIASCRVAAYRSTWNRFRDIELADFDNAQIRQFIQSWFSSELDKQTKTSDRCWRLLNEPSNAAAKELSHTPLLLTFLCLIYDRTQGFPSNRATLYRKALDILLEEWAAEKRITSDEIYQGLNIDLEKVLLSEIAYKGFVNDQYFFTEQQLVSRVKSFLADTVDKPKYLDGKAILTAIVTQQGIFVERAEDIFSFSHLTIQEYLTAQFISQNHSEIQKLATCIRNRRWREIFLLVSGLMSNSDEFLKLIEKVLVNRYVSTVNQLRSSKLINLLTWASKVTTSSEGSGKQPAKRAAAIFLLFDLYPIFDELARCLALDYADMTKSHHYSISTSVGRLSIILDLNTQLARTHPFALDLAYAIDKAKIFNKRIDFNILISRLNVMQSKFIKDGQLISADNYPIDIREKVFSYIWNSWIQTLGLSVELVEGLANLSFQEAEILEDYLYSNELLVQCQQTSIRVSEKVWKGIEDRILVAEVVTAA
jgi:hypothetical protein